MSHKTFIRKVDNMKNIRHQFTKALAIMFITGMTLQGVSAQNVNEDSLKADSIVEEEFEAPDTTGALTIDYAAPFRFGKVQIKDGAYTIDSISKKDNVQVSDRRAIGAGWSLSAKLSNLTNTNTSKYQIKNAKITMTDGTVEGAANSAGEEPTVTQSIELQAGAADSTLVTKAEAGAGMGIWLTRWDNVDPEPAKVQLHIDDSTLVVGQYTGTINWTLAQQP